jgi:hypothetical protein
VSINRRLKWQDYADFQESDCKLFYKYDQSELPYFFSPLDAILDATELDIGGQSCTTIPRDVRGLSDTERSESVVDKRSENS